MGKLIVIVINLGGIAVILNELDLIDLASIYTIVRNYVNEIEFLLQHAFKSNINYLKLIK